jgi:HK97 family phage major capsid protein
MSIQAAREKIEQNIGGLIKVDPNFANNISARYDAAKAKGGHPAEFRRLQSDVKAFHHEQLGKPGAFNADRQAVSNALHGWSDLLQCEIDLITFAPFGNEIANGPKVSGWRDAATGKAVSVYSPKEQIAASTARPEFGVGDILAGMLHGPRSDGVRAALSEGTDSAGGYSIPLTVLPQFFDRLRSKTQFIQAGAQTLVLDGMKTRIMRVAADPAPAWRAENAALTESAPTFDAVDFLPRSLAVLVKVSEELLADSVNVASALEMSLLGALSVELDRACLFGSGSSNEPLGLFNLASGINTVSMGTNGMTPASYDEIIDALYEVELDNGMTPSAGIMHPRTARTLRKLKDTTGQPLMLPPALAGFRMLSTTSVPITQTQGTATGVCSTTLVGDFSQAILGLRQSLMIRRLDQTFAGNLQVGFLATMRADVGFAHPESFTKIIGIKP